MASNPNVKPSQRVTLLDAKDPVSQGIATVTTAWLDARDFESFMALLATGAMTAASTVDAKLEQATSSGGAGAKDVAGKAITQLTQAGADSNKQVVINLKADDLDVQGGFRYFRLSITVAAAASLLFAAVFGLDARYQPATPDTTVDEVVG